MKLADWRRSMFASSTVSVQRTQGHIMGLLHSSGADRIGFVRYQQGGGEIIFNLQQRGYKIATRPILVELPRAYQGDPAKINQAREAQAWRWVWHYLKALLGMELFRPLDELLLPFMLVPGRDGDVRTLSEWASEGTIPQLEAEIGP